MPSPFRFVPLPLLGFVLCAGSPSALAGPAARTLARDLADAATDESIRDELREDVALTVARGATPTDALPLAAALPTGRRAMVLLEVAAHLPAARRTEADRLALDAQTAKAMTHDWRRARLARLLALAQARLDHFEAAEALAHTVPDTEERAFALQEVVNELCRAGNVAKARELAATIEENRRYGTYRQKAAALAVTARTLRARGNPDDATTLLAQAELLLPKKPGWSDGIAFVAVAEAAQACGQPEKARELLEGAEKLAQSIAGSWRISELARVAAGWRNAGDAKQARESLEAAARFIATLPPLERGDEAPTLARAWFEAGEKQRARATLLGVIDEAKSAANPEPWRKPHVRALLAWAELFGGAAESN